MGLRDRRNPLWLQRLRGLTASQARDLVRLLTTGRRLALAATKMHADGGAETQGPGVSRSSVPNGPRGQAFQRLVLEPAGRLARTVRSPRETVATCRHLGTLESDLTSSGMRPIYSIANGLAIASPC